MKKQIVLVLTLMIALVSLNSCEKEALEAPATENTAAIPNVSLKQYPAATIAAVKMDQIEASTRVLNNQLGYRSRRQWIARTSATLNPGELTSMWIDPMDPNYLYTAILTPTFGDCDLYIQAGKPGNNPNQYRTFRISSNPGSQVEEASALLSDLRSGENQIYFSIYANTRTQCTLDIYREPIIISNPPR